MIAFSGFGSEGSSNSCDTRARREYWRALAAHNKSPQDTKSSWEFGRACFDLAEIATNSSERAEAAGQGIAVCREALARDPSLARAHYYLGMNLGQLARTRGLSALKLVSQMEQEFKRTRDLDEKLDHGGPDRNLGLLYRDAPRVMSIGSRSKALRCLQKAVDADPDFPENRLNLIESYWHWSDRNGAKRELKALEDLWPRATAAYTGPDWACTWPDWTNRLQQAKKKVGEPPKALESPRGKD